MAGRIRGILKKWHSCMGADCHDVRLFIMLKSITRFSFGALAFVTLGVMVLYAARYFQYRKSPEYTATLQRIEEPRREPAGDAYGGSTPEETFTLFILALKKGDTDLAARYFVQEKQELWRADFAVLKGTDGLLDEMIRDLEAAKRVEDATEDRSMFSVFDVHNDLVAVMNMVKVRGIWKIESL
jgi:hypothetical protein